ncbi:MAG: N-acetyltransferase [Actinobacteria bacterium]|nr:N-acetyltransferase [Actinomycetota bacterium]
MGAAVRAAAPADMGRVAEIYAHYVTATVTTFDIAAPSAADWQRKLGELAGRGLPFLVAETGGQVAGYAYAAPWRSKPAYRHTVEDSIYLDPAWRGQGLGRLLLDALLAACTGAGVRQVIAVIAVNGDAASAALHGRFGFAEAGRLTGVGRKHGRWIDTLLMQRDLIAAPGSSPR